MTRQAIIDIGSNTIVLVIYDIRDNNIHQVYYESHAKHIVSDITNNQMSKQGLLKITEMVTKYLVKAKEFHADVHVDITACGRGITNPNDMIQTVKDCGIEDVMILTGEQEAICDFYGTSLDRTIENGILIDIGGGSTELVTFKNNQPTNAISIPLGCVRLLHSKDAYKDSMQALQSIPFIQYIEHGLGVGGTVRYVKRMHEALYDTPMTFDHITDIYKHLRENDPHYIHIMHENVSEDRWDVFVPGIEMLLAVCDTFSVQTLHNSNYGVREGFLLCHVLKRSVKDNF